MKSPLKNAIIFSLLLLALASCKDEFTPKPKAYARIALPTSNYISADETLKNCPYSFDYADASYITVDPRYEDSLCWYNVYYPNHRATLHLTYSSVEGNLSLHIEESRKLAMKHIGKASSIDEQLISFPEHKLFGIMYDFKGETASDFQFFVTDSTNHFLRGALYFNVKPNKDSLAPVISHIEKDIKHLVSTFRWVK
jgi:gliding motility-associated lipoprotein GldD